MENGTHLQQGFLSSLKEEEYALFAEVDYLLRSGTHIQNTFYQRYFYQFLKRNQTTLSLYYMGLFRLSLLSDGSEATDEKFYYLQVHQERDNIGGMKSNRIKKLSDIRVLFGVYLLYLYRVEKLFDKNVEKDALIERLTTDPNYKNHIEQLFSFGKSEPKKNPLTDMEDKSIENWVESSLDEFETLGFTHYQDNTKEVFEILPAIIRIEKMYEDFILHINQRFNHPKQ